MANLPEDFVEEASTAIRGPLFGYYASYGLPANFSADGNFTTNIVTFQFSLGGKWRYQIDKQWGLSLVFDFSYVIGRLREFGYDSKITSCRYWFDYLDNAAIQNHALDPANFGHPSPNRDTYLLE